MRLGIVIGTVTLNRQHESLGGGRWRLITPLSWQQLAAAPQNSPARLLEFAAQITTEPLAAFDELHAGLGSLVTFTEGREAANAFHPAAKPVDAYVSAIIDQADVVSPATLGTTTSGAAPKKTT